MSKREGKPGEAGVEGEGEGVGIGEGEGEGEAIGEEGEGEGEGKEGVVAFGSAMIYSITTFTFENEKRMGIGDWGGKRRRRRRAALVGAIFQALSTLRWTFLCLTYLAQLSVNRLLAHSMKENQYISIIFITMKSRLCIF